MNTELLERIEFVAKKIGMSRQAVMRLAMNIGLEHLKRCNYDLAGAVVDAVNRDNIVTLGSTLAEDATEYKAPKRKA